MFGTALQVKKGFVGDVYNVLYDRVRRQILIQTHARGLIFTNINDSIVDTDIASAIILMFEDDILSAYDSNIAELNSLEKIEERLKKVAWYAEPTALDRKRAEDLLNKFSSPAVYSKHANSLLSRIKDLNKRMSRRTAFAIYSSEYLVRNTHATDSYLIEFVGSPTV